MTQNCSRVIDSRTYGERRYQAIGASRGVVLFVAYTMRESQKTTQIIGQPVALVSDSLVLASVDHHPHRISSSHAFNSPLSSLKKRQ